jgi:four helix bundle protein
VSDKPFRTFEDLEVWRIAREFRGRIYAFSKRLPEDEKYNLVSQMRRAALSLTSNIVEGHGRFHYQENIQFLRQARGSLEELIDDLTLCADEQYLPEAELAEARQAASRVRILLNGYIRYLRERKAGDASSLREQAATYGEDDPNDS